MLRPASSIAVWLLLSAASAHAQQVQVAVHLNEPTGSTQYLSVTNKAGLEGLAAYTIEAWVYPSVATSNPTIVGNDYHASYWLGLGTAGRVRFYPRGGAGLFFEGTTSIPVGRWTHIAVTYNSAAGSAIYVNGAPDGTNGVILGAVGTSAVDLRIGADREATGPAYHWQGALDEVRIWNVARTATEIRDHYRIGLGSRRAFVNGRYDPLVALWAMASPSLTTVFDAAGDIAQPNTASFVGGTSSMVREPGPPTSDNTALALNGIDDHAVLPMADGFANGLTIDAWVAPTSFAQIGTIVGRDFRTSFWLGLTTEGKVRFYPTGGFGQYFESNTALYADRWSHVAVTYRPGDAVIYINGEADAASTVFSAPVGENGRDVWVGGDNEDGIGGTPYAFTGYLDNVRIARGVWSVAQIRERSFRGLETYLQPANLFDEHEVPRETWGTYFGQRDAGFYTVTGSGARLVRSGAPLVAIGMGIVTTQLSEFENNQIGGAGSLPDGECCSFGNANLFWSPTHTISSAEVFVYIPSNSLPNTRLQLRSPAGTIVELLTPGDAEGMDLHTVFSDASPHTLASGFAPYYHGVRPSQPLAAFNGENAHGSWQFRFDNNSSPTTLLNIWSWGFQFDGLPVGVNGSAPNTVALRNTSGNPVRGSGQITFTLPRAASADLTLHDAQGRRVRTLLAGPQTAGSFALGWNAGDLAPGAYFLRLAVDGEQAASLRVSVVR